MGWRLPDAVVLPTTTAHVAAVLRLAAEHRVPVTPRGSGTGLSGACVPTDGGIVVASRQMNRVLEIDTENHVAVVQPGVTLEQLNAELAPHGFFYPVSPGENCASLGRQRGHQRRRHAGGEVRRHPPPRPRPGGGPARRRGHPHRRQAGEDLGGLRPHPAPRRLRGDPGRGHRGDGEAPAQAGPPQHPARPLRHPRRGGPRRAPHRGQRRRAPDDRVHRPGHHGRASPRPPASTSACPRRSRTRRWPTWSSPSRPGGRSSSTPTPPRWPSWSPSSVPSTSTSCPRARPPSSSRPGRRRSGWPRPTAPTTSSTPSCPGRRSPPS